jgi:hypothetical protein
MHWREPIIVIVAVLMGAWLVTKWPSLNVIGRVTGM